MGQRDALNDDLTDLMRVYSRRGFRDWTQEAADLVRRAARDGLPDALVENEWEINRVILGKARQFIPMPKHGYKKLDWCFFWPKVVKKRLQSLTLLILVNRANSHWVAFRFESGVGAHEYTHVQMTSRWSVRGATLPVPQWLPASYPAVPIPAETRTELFLAMVTAVHGRFGGIDVLMQDLFPSSGWRAERYGGMLEGRLLTMGRGGTRQGAA